MNLQHHPDVVRFLEQLRSLPATAAVEQSVALLPCPLCGGELEIEVQCGGRICALCRCCDFHAVVPLQDASLS